MDKKNGSGHSPDPFFSDMTEKQLIESSLAGDKQSLETLIVPTQGMIFNLALRFLWTRQDAEDATQEIMIKVITNLSKFHGQSKFSTWAYRVATNYLINLKQSKLEKVFSSFDVFAQDLQDSSYSSEYDMPDKPLMMKEVKTGCTLAMLQCLDRNLRIAFILGSSLNINSTIAAEITETTPANFRKRLEKARKLIGSFLNGNCGVYNPKNPCRCEKRISPSVARGRISKSNLQFVGSGKVELFNKEMEELSSLNGIYQNHGDFTSKNSLVKEIRQLISTGRIINFKQPEV